MIAQAFLFLLGLQVGKLCLTVEPKTPTYIDTEFFIPSADLFITVFASPTNLGVEGTRRALVRLNQNQRRELQADTEIARLLSISQEMTMPCDRELLKSAKTLVQEYRDSTENVVNYLKHYHDIIEERCKTFLKSDLPAVVNAMNEEELELAEELRAIYSSSRLLYEERGELAVAWLLKQLDLLKVNNASDLQDQIESLIIYLTQTCAGVRNKFRRNRELVALSNEISKEGMKTLDPELTKILEWLKVCKKANVLEFQEDIMEQTAHRIYEIDSPVWTVPKPEGLQALIDEWRWFKRSLYSPHALAMNPPQVLSHLQRLVTIWNTKLYERFSRFSNNWDEELLDLSNLSTERCTEKALAHILDLEAKHARSQAVVQYIRSVYQAQMTFCISKLHELIADALGPSIQTRSNLSVLDRIMFLYQGDRQGPNAFSGQPIIQAIKYHLNRSDDYETKVSHLRQLKELCQELVTRLSPLLEIFNRMRRDETDTMGREDRLWMYGTKMCLAMKAHESETDDDTKGKKKQKVTQE